MNTSDGSLVLCSVPGDVEGETEIGVKEFPYGLKV